MLRGLYESIFEPTGLTPHGFCLLWEPGLIWLHAISDLGIAIAYFTIPVALVVIVQRRSEIVFRPVLWLFAAFILLCGAGHLFDLVTLWVPAYWLEGSVKAATAIVSILTAIAVWKVMPFALAMPSQAQLQEADRALRESEALYRAWFERSPTPVTTQDEDGAITGVSESWLALLGYTKEEVIGHRLSEFRHPNSAAWSQNDWEGMLTTGETRELEKTFVRKDGATVYALVKARMAQRGGVRWVVTVFTDISARRRAEEALRATEERLRQAQKMEAIGQLTGGVAHDFNNVLTAVMGSLELIRRRTQDDRPEIARFADTALQAAGRAAGLTAQLLSFSRRQRLDAKPLDAAEVAHAMLPLLERTVGQRISLQIEQAADAGLCLADQNQLESSLLNLVINARDAMNGVGTIVISVGCERVAPTPEGSMAEAWLAPGDYVRIAVRDDGGGMPEEVRRRAFEPFFTTKQPGQGSGLGLSQIHGFAHQSGGTATIDSTLGHGTEVAILLPRAGETETRPPPIPNVAVAEAPAGHGERLLLVEDDRLVRATFAGILQDLGYEVIEASDADAAIILLEESKIDAILTDLTMPGTMDGLEFATFIQTQRPGMPIVLLTGHLDPFRGRHMPTGIGFMQKTLLVAADRQHGAPRLNLSGRGLLSWLARQIRRASLRPAPLATVYDITRPIGSGPRMKMCAICWSLGANFQVDQDTTQSLVLDHDRVR